MPILWGFQRPFPKEEDREMDTIQKELFIKRDNGQIKSLAFGSVADERHNFYICTDKQICRKAKMRCQGGVGVPHIYIVDVLNCCPRQLGNRCKQLMPLLAIWRLLTIIELMDKEEL